MYVFLDACLVFHHHQITSSSTFIRNKVETFRSRNSVEVKANLVSISSNSSAMYVCTLMDSHAIRPCLAGMSEALLRKLIPFTNLLCIVYSVTLYSFLFYCFHYLYRITSMYVIHLKDVWVEEKPDKFLYRYTFS